MMKDRFFDNPHAVTLKIEEDVYTKLKKLSRDEEMSVGPYIRKIIKLHINSLDKKTDAAEITK